VSPGYWTAGRRRDRFRSVTGPGWLPAGGPARRRLGPRFRLGGLLVVAV